MTNSSHPSRGLILPLDISEFWSAHLGLTLITISLTIIVFVITPLREAGLRGRLFFDLVAGGLMIFAALAVEQSRAAKVSAIGVVLISATVLGAGRLHPTQTLRLWGSIFVVATLLFYIRIVLLVMFSKGPVTWSRIQGGVCVYLLIGMAWASAFQFLEQLHPGSFHFASAPADIDQLTSKLTYYSFATLTTVGSSITPVDPFARSLTIAEAIVGQLFPPTLIAALVAMAMQARPKS
jgi:voltage-gated potassium channel